MLLCLVVYLIVPIDQNQFFCISSRLRVGLIEVKRHVLERFRRFVRLKALNRAFCIFSHLFPSCFFNFFYHNILYHILYKITLISPYLFANNKGILSYIITSNSKKKTQNLIIFFGESFIIENIICLQERKMFLKLEE